MSFSEKTAKKITDQVLSLAKVKELSVQLYGSRTGNTRFANNEPTTNGDVDEMTVSVTATVDGRSATVSGNRRDRASLETLVGDAEALAALSPVDPEHMPPLGPQKYVRVAAKDRTTAKLDAKGRVALVRKAIEVASKRDLVGSGFLRHSSGATAGANTAGLFAYHAQTSISMSVTCRTKDGTGSGRAVGLGHKSTMLDAESVANTAAEKAEMSANPQPLDAGKYTVLLEPQAVADLLSFLTWSLSSRSADEGRSYFGKKGGGTRVGEKLFDDRISLRSDPSNADHPSSPFSGSGLPQVARTWIDKGVLKSLTRSRYWAKKTGQKPIPGPGSLFLEGTSKSLVDLLGGIDRGVLVTRFWYNRMVEPRTILATGLTRDGTFLIEQGKITSSVNNFRYNESPLTLLKNVMALGTPQRVDSGRVTVVPPMVVDGFNFASKSDAV